jgi:hypothetical protein
VAAFQALQGVASVPDDPWFFQVVWWEAAFLALQGLVSEPDDLC